MRFSEPFSGEEFGEIISRLDSRGFITIASWHALLIMFMVLCLCSGQQVVVRDHQEANDQMEKECII